MDTAEQMDQESGLLKYTKWKRAVLGKLKLGDMTSTKLSSLIDKFNVNIEHTMYTEYERKIRLAHSKKRIDQVKLEAAREMKSDGDEKELVDHEVVIKVANNTIDLGETDSDAEEEVEFDENNAEFIDIVKAVVAATAILTLLLL